MCRSNVMTTLHFLRYAILYCAVFISYGLSAHELENINPEQNKKHPPEVTVAVTAGEPPFYTLNGDGGQEWVLIKSVFTATGHHIARPLYVPASEAIKLYDQGLVDAIWMGRASQDMEMDHWHLSDPLLPREFVAVTLTDSELTLSSPADLKEYYFAGLPQVIKLLGDDVIPPIIDSDVPNRTCPTHTLLLLMLFDGRLDVAICEKSTYEYFHNKQPSSVLREQAVTYHRIFPIVYPRLVFHDNVLRDEFNAALKKIRSNDVSSAGKAKGLMLHQSDSQQH